MNTTKGILKLFSLLVLSLGLVVAWAQPVLADGPDLVFDLDGTLLENIEPHERSIFPERTLSWGEQHYRFVDFAPEVLAELFKVGYRISIFSGGVAERNELVANRLQEIIRFQTGQNFRFHRILSYHNLTPVFGKPDSAPFRERFKKDLQHVSPDMVDVVLIDDIREFSMPGQERHLLQVPETHQDSRSAAKLLVVMETLLKVKDLLRRQPVSFMQAVWGLAKGVFPYQPVESQELYRELIAKGHFRLGLPARGLESLYPVFLQTRSCQRVWMN